MAIEWSARARTDLRELRTYIAQDSPHYARRFQEDIRELIFQNYRIIYRIKSEHVYIVTVLHGSRDLGGQAVKPWEVV